MSRITVSKRACQARWAGVSCDIGGEFDTWLRSRNPVGLQWWDESMRATGPLRELMAEIAHTLGISRGAVKSTASRGLDAVARMLEAER